MSDVRIELDHREDVVGSEGEFRVYVRDSLYLRGNMYELADSATIIKLLEVLEPACSFEVQEYND